MFGVTQTGVRGLFQFHKDKDNYWIYKSENKELKIVDPGPILEVLPAEPVNVPERLSPYFIVEIPELIVGPKTRVIELVKIPCEIVVRYNGTIIDAFFLEKPKFALYGPPDEGIVARYVKGEFVPEAKVKEKGEKGFMYVPLRIKNYTKDVARVKHFLLDATYLDLYYRPNTWFATTEFIKLDLKVDGKFVRYTNKPYNKFKHLEHIEGRRKVLTKEIFEMRWEI